MRRLSLLFLLVAGLIATPARAEDPVDVAAATAQTTSDQTAAALHYATYLASSGTVAGAAVVGGAAPSNITCTKPVVYAAEVVQHRDLIVAETHQTDYVVASAACVDATGAPFRASIELRIEFCALRLSIAACWFQSTGYGRMVVVASTNGVAAPTADLAAVYSDSHAALGKIRRAFACVRTSRTGTACQTYDYSATYGF